MPIVKLDCLGFQEEPSVVDYKGYSQAAIRRSQNVLFLRGPSGKLYALDSPLELVNELRALATLPQPVEGELGRGPVLGEELVALGFREVERGWAANQGDLIYVNGLLRVRFGGGLGHPTPWAGVHVIVYEAEKFRVIKEERFFKPHVPNQEVLDFIRAQLDVVGQGTRWPQGCCPECGCKDSMPRSDGKRVCAHCEEVYGP